MFNFTSKIETEKNFNDLFLICLVLIAILLLLYLLDYFEKRFNLKVYAFHLIVGDKGDSSETNTSYFFKNIFDVSDDKLAVYYSCLDTKMYYLASMCITWGIFNDLGRDKNYEFYLDELKKWIEHDEYELSLSIVKRLSTVMDYKFKLKDAKMIFENIPFGYNFWKIFMLMDPHGEFLTQKDDDDLMLFDYVMDSEFVFNLLPNYLHRLINQDDIPKLNLTGSFLNECRIEVLESLLDNGFNPNNPLKKEGSRYAKGTRPLHQLLISGNFDKVKLILDKAVKNIDIDVQDAKGYTPLTRYLKNIIRNNDKFDDINYEMTELLIRRGANPHIKDYHCDIVYEKNPENTVSKEIKDNIEKIEKKIQSELTLKKKIEINF